MAINNQIILKGNLGQDPDMYQDKNGRNFVIFSLCTQNSYKDEQTQEYVRKQEVWHRVFAFGKTAEIANSYKKGQRIEVQGELSYKTTKAMIKGETRSFKEATITAYRIEDARLTKKLNPTSENQSSAQRASQGAA